jgi:Ca2+-binding RTX toxin-like protein
LTATALVIGTDLTILTDASEDVIVQANAVSGNAEVLIDGTVLTAGSTIPAVSLTSLTSITGSDNNQVDLSLISAGVFTSLTTIDVDSGDGDDVIIGTSDVSSTLAGGDGNDSITGGGSAEIIRGGDGQDMIDGGAGNDDINAGDGDDSVLAGTGDDTVTGDDGDDTIRGGEGNDSILANNGADSIFGELGDDTLNGDGGFDSISGGDGNDVILAGADNDTVSGGLGNDTVNGQSGDDSIDGNEGDDSLNGQAGQDSMNGNDVVNGNSGNGQVAGQAGDDSIYGGSGSDSLFGDGLDTVSSAVGNDRINGNSGDDTIIGGSGSDLLNGGTGDDLVRSTFELSAAEVLPPPPPIPPAPGPMLPPPGTALDDAVDSGGGTNVGNNVTLTNGTAETNVDIQSIGPAGDFRTALYNPVGAQPSADTTFDSEIYFRTATIGARQTLQSQASNVSTIRSTGTEANSSFSIGNLTFTLTQLLEPLFDDMSTLVGTLFTQTYRITNSGTVVENFDLVRYMDGDLLFDGTLIDGGGFLTTTNNELILFETDAGGNQSSDTTFLGVTGIGGTEPATDRFSVESCCVTFAQDGTPLSDAVMNNNDGDDFVDIGLEFDVSLAMRNVFSIPVGGMTTYSTHTIFGSGAPDSTGGPPPNVAPTATDDTAALSTTTGGMVTFDAVSNDNDPDGALDFSTGVTAVPPADLEGRGNQWTLIWL